MRTSKKSCYSAQNSRFYDARLLQQKMIHKNEQVQAKGKQQIMADCIRFP